MDDEHKHDDRCPFWERKRPSPFSQCILTKPLLLCIPPGGMTVSCPEHPEGHFLQGTEVYC